MKKIAVFGLTLSAICFLFILFPQAQVKQLKQKTYTVTLEKRVQSLEKQVEALRDEIDAYQKVFRIKGINVEIRSQGQLRIASNGMNLESSAGMTVNGGSLLKLLGAYINIGENGSPALTQSSVLISGPPGSPVQVTKSSATVLIRK